MAPVIRLQQCCQQLSDGACLYQRAGMPMLTELTDQNQISTSTFSYPGVLHWDLRESNIRREAPFLDTRVTITDQNTTPSSWSMTAKCDNIFHINALPPSYPTLSACLAQATPSNLPDQLYILAPCYLDASQIYYYDQNSLGPPMAEELWQCQQAYGSVSCSENQASSLHPEMMMARQEIQPMNIQTPFSTLPSTGPHLLKPCQTPVLKKSTRLDTYEDTECNQDTSPLPSAYPGMQQPLKYSDVGSLRQKIAFQNATLGNSGLGLEEPEALHSVMESRNNFADMTTLVADNHLPQLLNFNTGLDQMEGHTASQTKDSKDIRRDQAQSCTRIFNGLSEVGIKKNQKVSDVFHGALQARTHHKDMLKEDDPGTIDNMANHVQNKSHVFVPKRPSVAMAQGKEKAKDTRENSSKKTEELEPSSHRVNAEEKPAIPKTKRKRNPPELSHDSFKKPRTHLGMHVLASVQVFHTLGKKSEWKTGVSSSRALLNFSSNKDPRTGPTTTSLGDAPREGRGPGRIPGNAQRPESSAPKRCPSLSLDELSPPGKVKLAPLPFLAQDKPQDKPVSRKLHCLASHRPTAAYPVRSQSHTTRQPKLKSSQPAPASTSLTGS
ncbi:uncharacterized protein C2orf78 homolog [Microtus ochrogaster]|uniref:Uncharacterized protein C2orf78 homolog n=1 Tax=Microtus ochrogaster TaxID=79684 RepID=A0ABM0LSZ8_MICOH|nr:uncharacterized protein C2orf78 homolog [Microtus ochrogaster]